MKDAITLNEFRDAKTGEKWESLVYVNATPDEGYVLRILEAHLINCQSRWVATPPSILVDMMNQLQEDRAKLLHKAIEILKIAKPKKRVKKQRK